MPSKLRKALRAVKEQTSISLAKVSNSNSSNLEVIILKATRHDEAPVNDRYVKEILKLVSCNKVNATACAKALAKRIGKTRNWIVALKSLILVLRIFQDGDPHFPKEVLHAMKRGAKILNLSNFRDDSNSNSWDYTAFVRNFALYLNERLDCFLTGKLQRRFTNRERHDNFRSRTWHSNESISNMKPAMLLDRLGCWQKLLDRALATRPTGAAKTNRLVLISLYAIVQESFDIYGDISDGLALLLDSFFHLQYQSCFSAFQVCVNSVQQFEELCSFYDLCKSIGVGRASEYPCVQKISEELIGTLQEFLNDKSSFLANGRSPPHLILCAAGESSLNSNINEHSDQCLDPSMQIYSERESELGSQCTSVEDLMSATDEATSPVMSMDQYLEQFEKRSQVDEMASHTDSGSTKSMPLDQGTLSTANSTIDLLALENWSLEDLKQEEGLGQESSGNLDMAMGEMSGWDLILMEAATASQSVRTSASVSPDLFDHSALNNLFDQLVSVNSAPGLKPSSANNFQVDQAAPLPENQYNPFLQDNVDLVPAIATNSNDQQVAFHPVNDMFSVAPTFHATPTFSAKNPEQRATLNNQDDPFAPFPSNVGGHQLDGSSNQQKLLLEMQLWLQNQDKIIAKNL